MKFIKKTKISLLTATLLVGLNSWAADTSITNNDGAAGASSTTGWVPAQSFTATQPGTGILKSIAFASGSGGASGSCTLKVYNGAGTGTTAIHTQDIGSMTNTVTSSSNYTLSTFTLNATVNITNGSTYTFEISPAGCVDVLYETSSTYSGGMLYVSGGAQSGYDMTFEIVQGDAAPATDSDGTLTANGTISEPIAIPSTALGSGNKVDIFDFTIADGGTADGLTLDVTQIGLDLGGTATNKSDLRFNLSGCATKSDIAPTGNAVIFPSLTLSVTDGGSSTCTVSAYWNANTNITDNNTITLSIDGDTNLTLDSSKTQMSGSNSAVATGNMATTVTATDINFTTEPAGSTSGSALTTQPVVKAVDAYNNVDVDYTGDITLSEASAGSLSGTFTKTLSSGVATFTDVNYTATADGESFILTATSSGTGSYTATANSLTSNVVATKLSFTTEPVPTSVSSGIATTFTTVPVVKAVDANNIVDTGWSTNIILSKKPISGTATSFAMSGTGDGDANSEQVTLTPSSGVATFSGLQATYTGSSGDSFKLEANSTNITSATSGTISVTAAPATPTNLVVSTVNNTGLKLDWTDASSNETGFKIYSSIDNSTFELNQTINIADTITYSFNNIPLDMQYYFKVSSYNGDGESNSSIENNLTAPTAPTSLIAFDTNASQINLKWSDASNKESGYKIYKSTDSGTTYSSAIATIASNSTEYNVTGLDENTTYYFKVGAYNGGGESNTTANDKTNDKPNIKTLNSITLNEDFGTDTSLVITTINDSDNEDINLTVDSNDSTIFTISKSWGDVNVTSGSYNTTKTITLTSEANKSGIVELNVTGYDGKDYISNIFNVTVTAVNDTPTIDINNTLTVVEKKGGLLKNYLSSSDVDNNTTLYYTLVTAPTNGSLYFEGNASAITGGAIFRQFDINNSDVNYTHNGSATTSDSFVFNVKDQSGATTANATFNIIITEFNDPPTYDINMTNLVYLEDSSEFNLSLSNIIDQENGDLNISLESNDTSLFTFTRQWGDFNITSSNYSGKDFNISFVPIANKYGTAELNITVWDGTNRVSKDFNVTLTAVNDAPTSADNTVSTVESVDKNFTSSDFIFSDVDGDSLTQIQITSIQSKGNLYIDADSSSTINNAEANVSVSDTISLANLSKLVYEPVAGEYLSPYTTFGFKVYDGTTYSTSSYTMTINVTEINNPPSFDINMTDINLSEGSSDFNLSLINISDPESRDLNITVESNDSTMFTITPNWTTNITNSSYSNDLNFTISPYTNAYGKAELNVTVSDGVNKVSKDFNITIAPSPDNPVIATISNISKDINFSDFNISIHAYDPDRGEMNVTVDINDTSLIDYNTTWYSSDYNLTYSEYCESNSTFNSCSYKDLNLTIKSKPNVDGIVRVTLKAEDNVSGQISKTFDINVSADNYVLADLNALSLTSPTTTNLTLASLGSLYNSTISWVSNNTAVITNSGAVTQGTSDTVVTLTATANILHSTYTKTFNITVTGTGDTGGGGGYVYVPPVTTTPEPEPTPEPTTDVIVTEDTIIIIDENTNGEDVNEEVVLINEVDTSTQIENYNEFSENADGTNSAIIELKDTNGEVIKTEIKTDIPKDKVTITTVDGGVETKAEIDNEDGSKTETKSKVNTNGTVVNQIKVTDKDGNEVTTKVSSTKVGTNVEINKDGSLTTTYKDNHGMEVKAVASNDGGVHHEVDITNDKGEVVKTIAKSNIKGSQVVIKDDGSVQTSAHTTTKVTNADGSESNVEVLVVVEGKSDGKATHIMQVKDESGNSVITKAESELDGAETIISEDGGVETTAKNVETLTTVTGEVIEQNIELKVQALPDGKAIHKLKIVNENGEEQITEATSEIAGAKTTIKLDNTIETRATITDDGGNENQVIAEAKANGVAIHSVEVKDDNGENIQVEATSEVPNTKTVIKADGVETSAKVKNSNSENVDIKVTADKNGLATHVVTVGDNGRAKVSGDISILSTRSTFAYSKVKGAKTSINKDGNVETIAQKTKGDMIRKAIVDTNPNGESTTYFKTYDSEGREIETIDTFQKGQFELGNSATIKEEDGKLQIDITSRVTKEIVF